MQVVYCLMIANDDTFNRSSRIRRSRCDREVTEGFFNLHLFWVLYLALVIAVTHTVVTFILLTSLFLHSLQTLTMSDD